MENIDSGYIMIWINTIWHNTTTIKVEIRTDHDDVIKWNIFRVTGHLYGEFTGDRWIPHKRSVTRSFDVFFDLRLNKRLSKQWLGWWIETPSRSLWCYCNAIIPKSPHPPCMLPSYVLSSPCTTQRKYTRYCRKQGNVITKNMDRTPITSR